ncbi:MAG TPA: GntR family transcriptional regulator, partial [Kiritimatiellia bacterium]|nr:GntR family transcriptional regulator [Kiritimatiellia bacterium]HPS09641.1 GntR family transcriptional regulator [Kiritimatiellia bacterium]
SRSPNLFCFGVMNCEATRREPHARGNLTARSRKRYSSAMTTPLRKPLYLTIFDFVRENIVSGLYTADRRVPTDGQLMRRFHTTRATVAKAMKELERTGLIQRRPGAGSFVRPANLAQGTFVSTLIAGLGDTEFFEPICAQIAQACHACNLSLIWGASSPAMPVAGDTDIEALASRFRAQHVAGVFFVPDELSEHRSDDRNLKIAQALTAAGIAVVLLDRDVVPFPEQGPYDLVGIDNVSAGYQQTRHLLDCGCRRILYVTRPGRLWTKSARIEGYRLALEQAGQVFDPRHICVGDANDSAFCRSLLRHKPDGIVCFHDPVAAHLLQNFQTLRAKIPEKLKIIGLDDVRYSQFLPIPITTLQQPCRSIGLQAADLMVHRINHGTHPPRRILFDTRLIVRGSSQLHALSDPASLL